MYPVYIKDSGRRERYSFFFLFFIQTPLHLAAVSPHGGICLEVLLNEGAEVQVQCKEGRTPLHMIALQGQFTRASSVIEQGE